ncbi:MAG: lytic transglycosylase domain-containing protein, partial [Acidobacteria bacterium]|nr:lytic transglycosylase domain-containing protein [Acidobacteriota bacterium]
VRPSPPRCLVTASEEHLPAAMPYAADIERAAAAAGLHPRLVAAVVAVESNFKPYAVSRVGAAGLMQLMPAVWLGQRLATPYDPATNLLAGARHLRGLIDRFGDVTLALAAYNAGVAPVERYGGVPPYRETRAYVRDVLGRFCPGFAADAVATPVAASASGSL